MNEPDTDVLIIGAGLSGISMAGHMEMLSPDRSYIILDRRDQLGGTWDLFRYPGVRSDSDMHTLGFIFEPWKHDDAIADGPAILEYLNRVVDERGIRPHMRFGQEVLSADWNSDTARWTITSRGKDGSESVITARWLYFGSGYYDYDNPHEAQIPGLQDFGGEVLHPQFWPDNLDYTGKKVVIIGSGATAITMVPAMADEAEASPCSSAPPPGWARARGRTNGIIASAAGSPKNSLTGLRAARTSCSAPISSPCRAAIRKNWRIRCARWRGIPWAICTIPSISSRPTIRGNSACA